MNFDDMIAYENESTRLDFKAVQYDKSKHEDFIKDVMAIANANMEGERYIIVGVNHKSSGDRDIVPIKEGDFIDSAIYQQIIRENIEPDISLDYIPYHYNGNLLGIFKIDNCDDKPYMMRKKYKNLKKGDCYIRKGTHQPPLQRKDIDEIFQKKTSFNKFDGNIKIGFIGTNYKKEIVLEGLEKVELPSKKASKKIEKILEEKKNKCVKENLSTTELFKNLNRLTNPFSPTQYENRTIEQLEKNLANVRKDYLEDDFYKWFTSSYELNIEILNEGNNYIEDASFKIELLNKEKIYIFKEFYEKPDNGSPFNYQIPKSPSFEVMNYPTVQEKESKIIVEEYVGDIRHHIPDTVFKVPIRIWLDESLKGEIIKLECNLFGKNLTKPIKEELNIKVN